MKKIISVSTTVILDAIVFFQSHAVHAGGLFRENLVNKIDGKVSALSGFSGLQRVSLPELAAAAVRALFSILAILFLALIVYGGYVWMMARGNEDEVKRGRSIVRHSIIGLIVVLSSYALGYFIIYWLSTAGTVPEGRPIVPGR